MSGNLRARWNVETQQDLGAYRALDTDDAAALLASDIDRSILFNLGVFISIKSIPAGVRPGDLLSVLTCLPVMGVAHIPVGAIYLGVDRPPPMKEDVHFLLMGGKNVNAVVDAYWGEYQVELKQLGPTSLR